MCVWTSVNVRTFHSKDFTILPFTMYLFKLLFLFKEKAALLRKCCTKLWKMKQRGHCIVTNSAQALEAQ